MHSILVHTVGAVASLHVALGDASDDIPGWGEGRGGGVL